MSLRDLMNPPVHTAPASPNRSVCVKHQAVITSSGYVSRTARQIYNLILSESLSKLEELADFVFPVGHFLEVLPSRNYDYLKDALSQLQDKKIKYDLLEKDGSGDWLVSSLLAEARIKDGAVRVHFAPAMRQLLITPEVYAKISLLISNNLSSKYALILYENALLWLGKRMSGSSGVIKLKSLRELLGCEDKYPLIKDLKKHVITKAVEEINVKNCGLTIKCKPYKLGKKIAGFTFEIKRVVEKNEQPDIIEAQVKPTFDNLADQAARQKTLDQRIGAEQAEDWYNTLGPGEQEELWENFKHRNQVILNAVNEYWLRDSTLDRTHKGLLLSFYVFCAAEQKRRAAA